MTNTDAEWSQVDTLAAELAALAAELDADTRALWTVEL